MIYPWHRQTLKETALVPATLLLGEEGDGRDTLALALAASFASAEENADLNSLIGNLTAIKKSESSAKEWFLDKNTDIMAVRPDQEIIPVDAVRRVIEFCALTPIALARRAVAILRAECLNAAAANALLKTLEEPAEDKILILSARSSSLLPPTITSRCRIVIAPRPAAADAREWVMQHGGTDSTLAFCGGAPIAAATTDENKIGEAAAHFAAGKNINIHAAAQTMANFDGWLDCLQKWIADGARAAAGLSCRYFPGVEKRQIALCDNPLRWLDAYAALIKKRRLVNHPLAADLFIKEILYDFRKMFLD